MPLMTPADLHKFLEEHFPQVAHFDLKVEHLDDTTIRVRLPAHERHLRPGGTISGPTLVWLVDLGFYLLLLGRLGPVALAVTTNLNINFMRKPAPADLPYGTPGKLGHPAIRCLPTRLRRVCRARCR